MEVDDMDIDLGLDVDVDEEAMNIETEPAVPLEAQLQANNPVDTLELEPKTSQQLAYEKVHIRGLDNLTTDDIKAFISAHSVIDFTRIEWIDDTSANILYDSADVASSALADFVDSSVPIEEGEDVSELRKAKPVPSHPSTELHVRIAFPTDVKKPRAYESSRFYLMNPEYDPRERRRRQDDRGDRRRGYNDRRYNKRPRDEEEDTHFDESMYDDDPQSLAARINRPLERRDSRSSIASDDSRRSKRTRHANGRGGDLFAGRLKKSTGDDLFAGRVKKSTADDRLRDRSASPLRDGDGRFGFDEEDEPRARPVRRRSFTPPRLRNRNTVNGNSGKELLDSAPGRSSVLESSSTISNGHELFPDKLSTPAGKELFPRKGSTGNHRRKDAFDAADETADLFANRVGDGSPERKPRSLADRITGGPTAVKSANNSAQPLEGFNIRGTAKPQEGFAIRGSALGLNNPKVKELFPDKNEGNEGKELFGGVLAGRGAQRRKAQDMFN